MGIFYAIVAVVGLLVSAVSASVSYEQSRSAQNTAADQAWMNAYAEDQARIKEQGLSDSLLSEQQRQANEAAAHERNDIRRKVRAEKARLRVAAGEAGVGGALPERLEGNLTMAESFDLATVEASRQNKVGQLQIEKKAAALRGRGSTTFLNYADTSTLKTAAALQIGGAVAKAAGALGSIYSSTGSGSSKGATYDASKNVWT